MKAFKIYVDLEVEKMSDEDGAIILNVKKTIRSYINRFNSLPPIGLPIGTKHWDSPKISYVAFAGYNNKSDEIYVSVSFDK